MRLTPLPLVAALAACTAWIEDNPLDRDELAESLDDTRAEVDMHASLLARASSLDEIRVEVGRHEGAMARQIGLVRMRAREMRCDGDGMTEVLAAVGDAEARTSAYVETAGAAGSMAAAMAACQHYVGEMHALLDRVRTRADDRGCAR